MGSQDLALASCLSFREPVELLRETLALLSKNASAVEITDFVNSLPSPESSSSAVAEMAERIRTQQLIELLMYLRSKYLWVTYCED